MYKVVFFVKKREIFSKNSTNNLDYGSQNVRAFFENYFGQNLKIVWAYGRDF